MFMIIFVLDDTSYLGQILEACSNIGISGATIIESTGLNRNHLKHVPMRYAYGDTSLEESGNSTLFAIVESENMVQLCLQSIEQIVGDLDEPNTGVFSAWPLTSTKGIPLRGNV